MHPGNPSKAVPSLISRRRSSSGQKIHWCLIAMRSMVTRSVYLLRVPTASPVRICFAVQEAPFPSVPKRERTAANLPLWSELMTSQIVVEDWVAAELVNKGNKALPLRLEGRSKFV